MQVQLRCIRCGAVSTATGRELGCPVCRATVPANLEVVDRPAAADLATAWAQRRPGLWRYHERLPVRPQDAVSLGEGATPLLPCPRLGVMAKCEFTNPTGSFKDRLASVAVAWAKAAGLPGVVAASSGNAGSAVAAYAARAALPCLILTTRAFPGTMQRQMSSFGAMVVATPTAPDRWTLARAVAASWGWLPVSNVTDPPVGSHPVGIEGYRTIAYEIAEDLGWQAPDAVVVPVGYGDSMAGIWRGFADLRDMGLLRTVPRMIAAETYGSLRRALDGGAEGPTDTKGSGSVAVSAAVPRSTYQALRAIRASGGTAIPVTDEEALRARRDLAQREGLLVEVSSALALAAARKLGESGRVVCLLTSTGVKDVEVGGAAAELPLAQPDLGSLAATLREAYGFAAD
jgi:threonine synthase